MDAVLDPSFLANPGLYLVAAAVSIARIGGLMAVFPGFTRLGLSGVLRGSVALILTFLLIPAVKEAWTQSAPSLGEAALLIFKETIIGLTIGLVLGIPFWAADAAGSFLDLQRASTLATLVDPSQAEETGVTATLFTLLSLALFYGAGGFTLTLGTLYDSYTIWPVGRFLPLFSADAGALFLGMLDRIFSMGLMLVIPLLLILLVADISLALLARAAPQLQVFDLSLSVKNLLIVVLFVPYLSFLVSYMKQDIGWLMEARPFLETIRGLVQK
jgi:type III secretion protein T